MFSKLCWHGNTCYCVVISDIVYSIIQDYNSKERERETCFEDKQPCGTHDCMLGKLCGALSGKLHSCVLGKAFSTNSVWLLDSLDHTALRSSWVYYISFLS